MFMAEVFGWCLFLLPFHFFVAAFSILICLFVLMVSNFPSAFLHPVCFHVYHFACESVCLTSAYMYNDYPTRSAALLCLCVRPSVCWVLITSTYRYYFLCPRFCISWYIFLLVVFLPLLSLTPAYPRLPVSLFTCLFLFRLTFLLRSVALARVHVCQSVWREIFFS